MLLYFYKNNHFKVVISSPAQTGQKQAKASKAITVTQQTLLWVVALAVSAIDSHEIYKQG